MRFLFKLAALLLVAYAIGFGIFHATLPGPAGDERTDAIVVLTGGSGRLEHGFDLMKRGLARKMLISGVPRTARPQDYLGRHDVDPRLFECCVTLGQESVDTRSNANEVARWLERRHFRSIRLVTNDFHMARARLEIRHRIAADVTIVSDAVPTSPDLRKNFEEYNKLLFAWAGGLIGI